MKSAAGLIAVLLLVPVLLSPISVTAQANGRTWNFDQDAVGKPAAGFAFALTGQGTAGQWVVTKEPTAPSQPNVLAQTSQDNTDYRFPLKSKHATMNSSATTTVSSNSAPRTPPSGKPEKSACGPKRIR
jgi:hypothetical protein